MKQNANRNMLSLVTVATLTALTALTCFTVGSHAFAADTKSRPGATQPQPLMQPMPPKGGNTPPPPPPPPAPVIPTVTTAMFSVAEVNALVPVTIKLDGINLGAGKECYGSITWGDGTTFDNSLATNGAWRTLPKIFTKAGTWTATVQAKSFSGVPCVNGGPNGGVIQATIKVNPPTPLPPSGMTKLVVTPTSDPKRPMFYTKWDGNGNPKAGCSYKLQFGDGTFEQQQVGLVQDNAQTFHTYSASGSYTASLELTNAAFESCTIGAGASPQPVIIP